MIEAASDSGAAQVVAPDDGSVIDALRRPVSREPPPRRPPLHRQSRGRGRGRAGHLARRDPGGCSTEEVCNALGIQETNTRVLLQRARAKVRAALEPYLKGV